LKAELEKENLMLKGEPLPEWSSRIIGRSEALPMPSEGKKSSAYPSQRLSGRRNSVGKELLLT